MKPNESVGLSPADLASQGRPAPLQINQAQYAHADRQAVQLKAINEALNNTDALLARYSELPEAHNGRYVGADLVKELFDDYNQSREARNRYNAPVHNSAAALAGRLFERAVTENAQPGCDRAAFLTGSPGSGKTTAVMREGGVKANYAVVYEGQMFRPEQSFAKIDAAIAQGLKPEIIAVHPRPESALENTFQRFDYVGRGASINVMSQIQGELAAGLQQIHARYGNAVELKVHDTREVAQTGNAVRLTGWQHLPVLASEGTSDEIKNRLAEELERHRRAGTITDACYRQAAGHAPIRNQLGDRRLGPGHDPDAERIEQKPHPPLSVEQARVLIATTAERHGLRSDELARAHFIARQDKDWAARYGREHGQNIARRSQSLAIQHGDRLANRLQNDDPVKGCTVYPELTAPHQAIAAAVTLLKGQGQPQKAIDAAQNRLVGNFVTDLKNGIGAPIALNAQVRQTDARRRDFDAPER